MSTATAIAPAARRRLTVTEASVPGLARGTQLRFDDDIAVEVLKLCDGARSVAIIIDELAAKYAAPREEIAGDVVEMLQDLAKSGFLVEAGERRP